jgi:hypothetical protein
MDEQDREGRVKRRTGRRVVVGGIIGTVIGAGVGLLIGAFIFDPWTAGHWAIAVALAILGGGIGMVQGGLSGLESVDPGAEPSTVRDPVRDEKRWTSRERDERDNRSA